MELILNELSISPSADKYKANETMLDFARTVAEGKRKGFGFVRSYFTTSDIIIADNYSMENWLNDKDFAKYKDYKDILFGMIVVPFIRDEDEHIEEQYIKANYYYEDAQNNITKTECIGLASAYLYDTLSISYSNNNYWCKNLLSISIKENAVETKANVVNVFSKDCFSTAEVSNKIEQISTLELIECTIEPANKNFHLTGHHGQKEMQELWDKIKHSKYVVEGMTIQWGGNTFYKNPMSNGKLDIVHMKSDRRYVLQIQTTGRNKRETIEIGKILEDKYS